MSSDQGPTYIWEQLNKYYQATRKPIHIAVAYTADAAAASLTLASLLKASLIAYDIQPVASNDELSAMVASANLAQDYARLSETDPYVDECFLLIGLGGAIRLADYFDFATRHIVVVLDAYRPFHLSNLREYDNERFMIWGSESIREEVDSFFLAQRQAAAQQRRRRRRRQAAKRRQRLRRQYGARGDGADDGARPGIHGGEGGNVYDDEQPFSSDDVEDEEEESDSDSDDDDDEDDDMSVSQSQERVDWTDPEDLPPYLEVSYYACDRAGRSCAVEAHDLAVLLNRFKESTLWHAAVGVCDLFNRRLIDYATYLVEMRPLHDAVTLQKSVRRGEANEHRLEESEFGAYGHEEGGNGSLSSAEYLRKRGSNAMELHNKDEEQLYLLRHTSLWDAIWRHPVTASVLRLHHAEDGEGLLRQLLAKCGVSAKMAQQPWREVPPADKTEALRLVQSELRRLIETHAKFLTFPNEIRCVSRTVGYSTEVSTFDVCALHEALMAAEPPSSAMTLEASFAGDAAEAQRVTSERMRRFHREQFWKAHAILDMDASAAEFHDAVQEALALQDAVAVATGALMQPGMLQSTTGLHYVIPSDPTRTTTALESFSTVYRLNALARRLLLALTVVRGLGRYTHAVRPLLMSCALPKPSREDADTSFAGFSPSRGAAAALTTASSAAAPLNELRMNTLPLATAAASGASPSDATKAGDGANARDMLFSSTTALSSSGFGGAFGNGSEEHEFLVVLAHEGSGGSTLRAIPSVGRFIRFLHDPEEFDTPPQQRYPSQRTAVVVADRATAAHLADVMYLACRFTKWDPQREYLNALAAAEEAQRPEFDDDDDDAGEEDGSEGGDASSKGGDEGTGGPDGAGDNEDDNDDDDDDEDRYFGKSLQEQQRQQRREGSAANDDTHGPTVTV